MPHPDAILRSPDALIARGLCAPSDAAALRMVADRYAIAAPAGLSARGPGLARQFVPDSRELQTRPGERGDPIGDGAHAPVRGVVHRYPDRLLLKPTLVCPVYCRFCFRREQVGPGAGAALSRAELAAALDYIRATPAIWEVILTGGDPLGLPAGKIEALTTALGAIAHVGVVRFHSRVPVATPHRVTDDLVAAMRASGKATVLAIHANHPDEFSPDALAAIARLREAGVMLLGQSVLLAGVNDDVDTLAALMRAFVAAGAKPYYLHHPDLASGTGHFRLPIARGLALVRALRGRISGLCQPTYALDIPGGYGKVALDSAAARLRPDGAWELTDFRGATHAYVEDARP